MVDKSNPVSGWTLPRSLNGYLAWTVLVLSLMGTVTLALHFKSTADQALEHDFDFQCKEISHRISARLDDHARVLLGGAALFNASDSVTREEWRIFANSQKLEKQLPGMGTITFALQLTRAELARHIQDVRNEGFPEYNVTPEGDREVYVPVIYVEPFFGRNLRVFGYDTFLEPVRREAMQRARDTDSASLSGKILLRQETGKVAQAGTIIFVPVYRKGMPSETLEQRRAAIYGWIASPCRMTDLIESTLNVEKLKQEQLHLELFDGDTPSPQSLLYECLPAQSTALQPDGFFTRQLPLDFNGHIWTLRCTKTKGSFFAAEYTESWATLLGGIFTSLILFVLVLTLLNTRIRAERIAEKLTLDLQKSVEHHRSLLQTAMDGYWLLDTQGQILECNETYVRMSGYSAQELLTLRVSDLDACESPSETATHVVKITTQGEDRFATQHRRKNGTLYDVEISAQYRPIEGGQIVAFIRDITERKKAEAELQKMQKLQSVGVLAGGIAHDFNNILMGIFGNISLAKSEVSEAHSALKPLEDAENSMNRAIRLTKQLLTFAKGGEPIIDNVSLGGVVETVARFDLSGSNVMLIYEQAPDLWMAKVDEGQIQQVISNLTTNARQAMPDGGHLYINLQNQILPDTTNPLLPPGKYVRITLRDEGVGIDPKIIDRIFDPYFTTKPNGCGLGLATTYSIMAKHGGHIAVTSRPGHGTTFTLYLPATPGIVKVQQKTTTDLPVFSPIPKVLVMDDEEYIRLLVPRWLSRLGCSATASAADGSEAVKLYQQGLESGAPFDVLILDITIPGGMGGCEALKEILAIDPNAKAIVSSGYADSPIMSQYRLHGFRGILPKPYTQKQLYDALAQVLQ